MKGGGIDALPASWLSCGGRQLDAPAEDTPPLGSASRDWPPGRSPRAVIARLALACCFANGKRQVFTTYRRTTSQSLCACPVAHFLLLDSVARMYVPMPDPKPQLNRYEMLLGCMNLARKGAVTSMCCASDRCQESAGGVSAAAVGPLATATNRTVRIAAAARAAC